MNTLDNLFKEKLVGHSISPSGGSWQRVEDGLTKKTRTIIWIRSAAVLALASFLVTMVMIFRRNDKAPIATETRLPNKREVAAEKSVPAPAAVEEKRVVRANQQTRKEPIQKQVETPEPIIVESVTIEEPVLATQVEPKVIQDQASKPIVLVYTLGPVEMPVTEKDGSLMKVVEFARNVKNTDTSPVGELRTMKEDLFALDFKKKTTSKNH